MNKPLGRALILIPLLLIFLVGLFYLLRPSSTQGTSTTTVSAPNGSAETIDVAIEDGVMNPGDITIEEGDLVNLRLTSDSPVEFHIHGYDIYADVEPGETTEFGLDATITGRFAIENHGLDPPELVGQLLVQPR